MTSRSVYSLRCDKEFDMSNGGFGLDKVKTAMADQTSEVV